MSERPDELVLSSREAEIDSPEPAEYNAKILSALALWVSKERGEAKLREIAEAAGLAASEIDGATRWLSLRQIETFNRLARQLVDSDDEFLAACGRYFPESMGPIRYLVRALSAEQLFRGAVNASKVLLRISRFEILDSGRTKFAVRYTSEHPESRLLCLSRQAGWIQAPAMWGLPPAQLVEKGCIANGDPHCEYHLEWFERGRLAPVAVGFLAGLAVGILSIYFRNGWLTPVALALLGAAIAQLIESRRVTAANLSYAHELNEVLRRVSKDEADARSEVVGLHQRQREWINLMERQVADRTTTLERIVEGLDGLQRSRVTTIRGFSHDLRNPLFVVRGNTQFLRERFQGGEEGEALRDMENAAVQIEGMLSSLMEVASTETGFVRLEPKTIVVAPLAETFRRRLKALVHGRDIKVTVFCTREAPDEIKADRLVFDRVVDNILTNAAKYTDRGSILLEISGTPATTPGAADTTPAFLTLKLSDTGLGIPPAQVERIFRPRPSTEVSTRPDSYGIGLSSVVRLLGQIGGRLDVMSKPDVGTTFWAHFPVQPTDTTKRSSPPDDNLESIITRVVTIRKVEGA